MTRSNDPYRRVVGEQLAEALSILGRAALRKAIDGRHVLFTSCPKSNPSEVDDLAVDGGCVLAYGLVSTNDEKCLGLKFRARVWRHSSFVG